jgi:hypothetical protein
MKKPTSDDVFFSVLGVAFLIPLVLTWIHVVKFLIIELL